MTHVLNPPEYGSLAETKIKDLVAKGFHRLVSSMGSHTRHGFDGPGFSATPKRPRVELKLASAYVWHLYAFESEERVLVGIFERRLFAMKWAEERYDVVTWDYPS